MWPFSKESSGQGSAVVQTIDVHEAFERSRQGGKLVDVRTDREFAALRPKGARHLPPERLAVGDIGLSQQDEILVICQSGHRSARQAKRLATLGFEHVSNVAGGLIAWQRAGLPVRGGRR